MGGHGARRPPPSSLEAFFGKLRRPLEAVASSPDVIPSSKAKERAMLVGVDRIDAALREAAA